MPSAVDRAGPRHAPPSPQSHERSKRLWPHPTPWRARLFEIIFEADTPAGKAFDVVLLGVILLSVLTVMLETVQAVDARWHAELRAAEWAFTTLFAIEYLVRLSCVRDPKRYAWSFYGLVDLLAIVPGILSLIYPGAQELTVVRALRLLRVFRVLKLGRFLSEAETLRAAIWQSRTKVIVFLTTILVVVTIVGAAMHLIEGDQAGFTSIPQSVYWAVVTMATVGYGDIVPQTPLGRIVATALILLGYSLIIVPTGIVTAELVGPRPAASVRPCVRCGKRTHDADAEFCKTCGGVLPEEAAR